MLALTIAVVAAIIIAFLCAKLKVKVEADQALRQEEAQIAERVRGFRSRLDEMEAEYERKRKLVEDARADLEQESRRKLEIVEERCEHRRQELDREYVEFFQKYSEEKESLSRELESLRSTKAATVEAFRKEQALKDEADLYRLDIDDDSIRDIGFLNSIKNKLTKPRIVSMLIWQTYYQPVAKRKFSIIIGPETKCGIYKITNLESGEIYIGQAKNIRKRWFDHCKCGVGIDTPNNNKLYDAMRKYGLENFSFEVLEECDPEDLNEKERFYISVYKSVDFGYNGNVGNSTKEKDAKDQSTSGNSEKPLVVDGKDGRDSL